MGRRKWSKEIVLSEIQKRSKCGLSLRYTEVIEDFDELYYASKRYFGSWRNAISATGLEYEGRRRRRWDRKKVIGAIRERKKKGLSLSTFVLQKEDIGLYIAARKLFRSWEDAMKASGMEYSKPKRRKWSKEKVIGEIKKLKKRNIKVNHNYIYEHYRPLYSAGYHYFGNWRKTLKAAGLDPDNPNK